MNNLSSLEYLIIKQTCRFFAYKFEMGSNQLDEEPPNTYSMEFLKALYEEPKENISKILKSSKISDSSTNKDASSINDYEEKRDPLELRILLDFFKKVVDMKSQPAKLWTDLQHYLYFVYRYCMTSNPEPEQEILSPYFITDMRSIVCNLMAEDEMQLCLRLFSLVREYTVFAQKQHQKIVNVETSIESLFYYYEAFLSATKNICKIFPELEKLLLNIYKLGWLDFNTSIFMYYFYETPHVQNIVRQFEQMKDNVSIKATGIYTVLTELHKLWRSQMLGINSVIASKLGVKFKGLDNKMMSPHKKILSKNFWIDRSPEKKALQDMSLFDYQLFTLVGNKSLPLPESTLDESGQCICEDCLIIKYKSLLENNHNSTSSNSMKVSCRFCQQQVDLNHFQQHINGSDLTELDGNNCKNLSKIISNNIDIVKLGMANQNSKSSSNKKKSHNPQIDNCLKRPLNGDITKDPNPKLANEPPIFKNDISDDEDDEIDVSKLTFPEFDGTKMSRKSFYNFLKYRNSLARAEKGNKTDLPTNRSTHVQNSIKQAPPKPEDSKTTEIMRNSRSTNTTNKNTGMSFPCGHNCKLEEELKSEFKKAYQDTCDHHKESKKCDCTFCEVFGTTSNHVHKTNETRNRLRIRLSQRNEKVNKLQQKGSAKLNLNKNIGKTEVLTNGQPKVSHPAKENLTPNSEDLKNDKSLMNDIHGLLNFIEGNTNVDKLALAEKKAAKKARQRSKKEQERQRQEEEERKRLEEEKRKEEERIRNEELARQLIEKAKNIKKESKKKKKNKNKGQTPGLVEETIPAMVTIKRVVENNSSVPTVTITLKGSTPDQDKLLYTLVNGHDGNNAQLVDKKNNKSKNQPEAITKAVNLEVTTSAAANGKKKKKNNKNDKTHISEAKEVKLTLAVDQTNTTTSNEVKKNGKNSGNGKQLDTKTNNCSKKQEAKKEKNSKESEINIPMLRLPPGITITKVDGPMTDRNYKSNNIENPTYNSNIPVSKSGVIVVDTEKLIKQSSNTTPNTTGNGTTTTGKKSRKKRNKKQMEVQTSVQSNKSSMVTLKNPIFQNMQNGRHQPEIIPSDLGNSQQASIFKNENGMVTIRSSRLQQSLVNGSPVPNLLSDLKPVLGPEVPTTYMSSCNFSEPSRISSFNAQEILSGLPGIEITKVDKNAKKSDIENKKSCHTAEVSIIPATNGDKFNFDKDDLHYDNVFTPKDIEEDMDADERELEAFKRFCQQSVPPKRKEKVAHLNVKDIVLKKKSDKITA